MQSTVTNTNKRKSLFSAYLEVVEAQQMQAQAERQLQEEKYMRRTQRIYDFHERQRSEMSELRRCLDLVSQHAAVLESALRGGAGGGAGTEGAPLSAELGRQAAGLARVMAACLADATAIRRRLLTARDQRLLDTLLAKMEAELTGWRGFVQRAVEATASAETTRENLHNLIAEQRRAVHAVCALGQPPAPAPPAPPCSTPIHHTITTSSSSPSPSPSPSPTD